MQSLQCLQFIYIYYLLYMAMNDNVPDNLKRHPRFWHNLFYISL